jgi:hypothetical protein
MITQQQIIKHIDFQPTPIQKASECYEKWMGDVKLGQDIAEYLLNGIVISTFTVFGLARIIALDDGEPVLFVRMAVGKLDELLNSIPFRMDKIAFCRRNDGRVRVYKLDALAKRVFNQNGDK